MKLHSGPAERNKEPIATILREWLPTTSGNILEVASGTGQHVVHFAQALPHLTWLPSDISEDALASIREWTSELGSHNIRPPIFLNITESWQADVELHGIFCANMIHISPWENCLGLFQVAQDNLQPGASLIFYGPFVFADKPTAPSNTEFDLWLKSQDERFGIREFTDVVNAGARHGFTHRATQEMPANNCMLQFVKSKSET